MRSVCVFLGSSPGRRPEYAAAAETLGRELVARDLALVYGGAGVGLMGLLADAVLTAGGEAVGVIPGALFDREVAHTGLTELHEVASMHERKALMADLADAFVALPGGYGTLEELSEVLTWAQLGIHCKPIGLVDVAGFWGPLLDFVDHAVDQGFVSRTNRGLLLCDPEPAGLLDRLQAWEPPRTPRDADPGVGDPER